MTPAQIIALGDRATCTAEEAISALGVGRTSAYEALRRGEFPVPAFKVGAKWVVPTAPLLKLLGLGPGPDAA